MNALEPSRERARYIVVPDEDPKVVEFVLATLRADYHAVFHACDVLSATQLASAVQPCDLVISDTKVEGEDGVELIHRRRQRMPELPIIYLANISRSQHEVEAKLPPDVPILREPFTAEELRALVNAKLSELRDGAAPDRG